MRTGFVESVDPLWRALIETTRYDVYHLPEYAQLLAREEGGQALLFVAEEGAQRLLIPLIARAVPAEIAGEADAWFDAASPYGYPGPLLSPSIDPAEDGFIVRAIESFVAALSDRKIVTCFVRLHPLLVFPNEPMLQAGQVIRHGETISIDLLQPAEAIWRQTRQNHQRDILKAERKGHKPRMDSTPELFEFFVDVYRDTMRRLDAAEFYFFSTDYLHSLRIALADQMHLCAVEIDGQLAAAGLFTECCGVVQYHLSGTRSQCMQYHPVKTMIHFVTSWAKNRGNYALHLGGGLGARTDSLFGFKSGFSPTRHSFLTWRVVSDEAVYRQLNLRWQALREVELEPAEGFFPAYRKPIARNEEVRVDGPEHGSRFD